MKKLVIVLALSAIAGTVLAAETQVDGYTRKDGTYVAPHYRTTPNETRVDNYGSRPNVNPHTGEQGTRDPYAQPNSNPYGQPQQPRQPRY